MFYQIEETVRRKAKSPHELFMVNLVAFHLLLTPVAIVLGIGVEGFLVPLAASMLVIIYTWLRARRAEHDAPWFVAAHWKLAVRRYGILLVAYAVTGVIVGIGLLVSMGAADRTMADILLTVFSRIAAVPMLITVMLCFVLESGSIYQAGRGEVPGTVEKHFPPPSGLKPRQSPTAQEPGASKAQ